MFFRRKDALRKSPSRRSRSTDLPHTPRRDPFSLSFNPGPSPSTYPDSSWSDHRSGGHSQSSPSHHLPSRRKCQPEQLWTGSSVVTMTCDHRWQSSTYHVTPGPLLHFLPPLLLVSVYAYVSLHVGLRRNIVRGINSEVRFGKEGDGKQRD